MSNATTDIDDASGWDELRFILKCVTPFATLVWSATLCWSLTEDLRWTIPTAIVLTIFAGATLFGPPEKVRAVWFAVFRTAAILVAFAAIGCILYLGVKATIAIVGWLLMFPFRHPFLFFGGLLLLFIAAAGAAEDQKPKTQFAHGPPFPAETTSPASTAESGRRKKRKRKKWSPAVRQRVWERCEKRCFICHETLPTFRGKHMHLDHLKPFSKGGACVESNLVAMCPECNLSKSANEYPELYDS